MLYHLFCRAVSWPPPRLRARHRNGSRWYTERGDPMSALGQKRTCALQNVMSALPPKADMCSAHAHVCFGPKADMEPSHSITSLALARSDGGTERPSALAVLRLITSSNLVGPCTGSSAGFSPLRMRST